MIVDSGLPGGHHRDCSTKYGLVVSSVSVPIGSVSPARRKFNAAVHHNEYNRERAPLLLMFGSLADRMADICAHDQA